MSKLIAIGLKLFASLQDWGFMKILLLAPQPFYIERGTPIAVDLMLQALSKDGHEVDLLTFPSGEPKSYENVTHYRIKSWFGITSVKAGFSPGKLILDVFLFFRMVLMLSRKRYQVVHAVEESVFMAMILAPIFRFKYIYAMDSSMAGQLVDRLTPKLRGLGSLFEWFESLPLRFASAVVPVCDALADIANRYRQNGVFLLKDVSLVDKETVHSGVVDVSQATGSQGPFFMYIGNLEPYQGIDLMIDGFALYVKGGGDAQLVIIGGSDKHINEYKNRCSQLGVSHSVHFLGPLPVDHLFQLMTQANVLVSPRSEGVNTPMKVYSYMDSGVPVLATNLPTHTQAMNPDNACLVEPNPESMQEGMTKLMNEPEYGAALTQRAAEYIAKEHSMTAFRQKVQSIYTYLEKL